MKPNVCEKVLPFILHGLPKLKRPSLLRNFKRIRVSEHQGNRHPDFIILSVNIKSKICYCQTSS